MTSHELASNNSPPPQAPPQQPQPQPATQATADPPAGMSPNRRKLSWQRNNWPIRGNRMKESRERKSATGAKSKSRDYEKHSGRALYACGRITVDTVPWGRKWGSRRDEAGIGRLRMNTISVTCRGSPRATKLSLGIQELGQQVATEQACQADPKCIDQRSLAADLRTSVKLSLASTCSKQ